MSQATHPKGKYLNSRNAFRAYSPSDEKTAVLTLAEAIRNHVPLVYCIRRTDDIVKIGHTTDLIPRLRKLQATAADVLCVIRGGREQEAVIHFVFRESRVTLPDYKHANTEHFRLTPELSEWINSCRAEMGLDPIA